MAVSPGKYKESDYEMFGREGASWHWLGQASVEDVVFLDVSVITHVRYVCWHCSQTMPWSSAVPM